LDSRPRGHIWICPRTRSDHDGYQISRREGIDVRFDFIVVARSPNLTTVKATTLHSCIKRPHRRLTTMAGAILNWRIEQ
jgi:hypothetical protein